ncbi:methyl-accepting chemotaxis protein [Paenibacillus hexagrammi]|uniref:Methyl-accepting chemotaxis protein n=1 Tax=Paenibacillus hexagrammi TaxID=2908839 RepID=A0ABY3SM64_9BACL|nr:methyl-accepting chemotaxis protein [Paenibacillus sp. YPD9-1]UJF34281.1 methyl-accepting chemotaxis protein [Paenibacillus sp. YPD9-1]
MKKLLSVRIRLILILLVPCMLYLGSSIYFIKMNATNIDDLAESLYGTTGQSTTLILNADRDMYQAMTAYQQVASGVRLNAEDRSNQLKAFKENIQQANDRVEQAKKILDDRGLLQLTHVSSKESIEQSLSDFHQSFDQWVQTASQNVESPTPVPGAISDTKLKEKFDKGRDSLDQIEEILDTYAKVNIDKKHADSRKMMWVTLSSVALITLIVFGSGIAIIRKIMVTIRRIVQLLSRVADGDLTMEPQKRYSSDELGLISKSADMMTAKMKELVSTIARNTEYVHTAAIELNDSSKESAASAEHVAQNIQDVTQDTEFQTRSSVETSRAVDEMAIGIQRVAENSGIMSEHSSVTSNHAEKGNELLNKLGQQMAHILGAVDMLSQTVQSLTRKSDEIGKIASSITGFANQTNLLSLNASIEAARAGEHGRGFHVVANEIRKLASQSIESAEGINALILETRIEISNVSDSMDATRREATAGSAIMDDVNHSFQTILQSVRQIVSQIHETSAVAQQMSASSEQVSATMEQSSNATGLILGKCQNVAAATEEQLAMMENIASAAEQLKAVVTTLNDSVSYFKIQ